MNEPQVSSVSGIDAAWSGRRAADGQADVPRPASVPRDSAGGRPAGNEPKLESRDQPESGSRSHDAAFPTSYARFSIDAKTQKLSIKIVDAVTDEVLREIPPEQVQRIAEDLQSLTRRQSGGKRTTGGDGVESVASRGVDRYV
jgi:hypothetical protein